MRASVFLRLALIAFSETRALSQDPPAAEAPKEAPKEAEFTPAPSRGSKGIEIPDGVKPSAAKTEFAEHRGRVVRVLAELGEQRAVVGPTGALTLAPWSETKPSDGPFKAATPDEIAAELKADGLGDYKIVPAGYYLFAYGSSEAYYLHTRSILESMLRGVVKQLADWGLEPQRPETPLVVVITPSRAAFDAIEKMPDGVAAYYNSISNRVVLYEDERLFDAAPEFALKQGSYVVAHEAIHQLLHNTGIQQRLSSWPAWVSEGLPEYFCPLRVHSSLTRTDGDELPVRTVKWSEAGIVNDLRMHDLLRTDPAGGRLIALTVAAPGLSAHGYSVAWGLTHFLAERREDALKAYLAELKAKPPLSALAEEASRGPDPLFVKHFGDDFAVLEKEVQRHLTSRGMQDAYRDPYLNQTHYVLSVTFKRGRVYYTQAGLSLSPASAREWTTDRKKLLAAEGIDAHIVTRECRTAQEAAYHLRKILD